MIFPPGEEGKNVPFNLKFGPSYFDSFDNFPSAKFIFDIPFAKNNLKNSLAFAKVGFGTIRRDRIDSLEIGNEPNFYPGGDRPRGYSPADFVTEWANWTTIVSEALGISTDKPVWEAVALASPRYPPIGRWNARNIFNAGLGATGVRERIKSYSIH